MSVIKKLYHTILPESMRTRLSILRTKDSLRKLRTDILDYYTKKIPEDSLTGEHRDIIKFLKRNPISVFPYDFQFRYKAADVEVYQDQVLGLCYTMFEGKKLYFKRQWDSNVIRKKYNFLRVEQDVNSPHRYLTGDFNVPDGAVVLDIGAAEGNFSLSIIERVSKIYLFEVNPDWIEALEATFKPWKEKVVIVNKYVSDTTTATTIRVDDLDLQGKTISFIKIDVEGAEQAILKGAENVVRNQEALKIALCTYHRQNDDVFFRDHLVSRGYDVHYSNGFMIFYADKTIAPPYLRRGLIRARKVN